MSFWNVQGQTITGKPEDAFVVDLGQIVPNNTTAPAQIKTICLVEKENKYQNTTEKYYEFTWKLMAGEYKSCEVTQKIKCFTGEPAQRARALNMLKLLMDLCGYKPPHANELAAHEMIPMQGKVLGIKVREWQIEKNDGSGFLEGNFVSEVHPITDDFITQTGIKLKPKTLTIQKSFDMQPDVPNIAESDIPF